MGKRIGWDDKLSVATGGKGLVGHAGAVLLRRCGDRTGLTAALGDPPTLHGPYYQWTRKVDGKTVTRLLNRDQIERYRDWFDNAQRARQLLAELETLSLNIIQNTEGWE